MGIGSGESAPIPCKIWDGRRLPKGYAVTGENKIIARQIVAERDGLNYDDHSWETRHLCGSEPCIEPSHLTAGDQRENELDKPIVSRSGYRGVGWNYNGWMARIRNSAGKRIYLGTFATPELAHEAYQEASRTIHGPRQRE